MKPKDIPFMIKIKNEAPERKVILIQDSLSIPHLKCWGVRQKGDTMVFYTAMDSVHTNGWSEPENWRVSYRKVYDAMWWDDDMERLVPNPIEIKYTYDNFYPYSTQHFFLVRAFMKYFKGFEIID